jgi:hypothetical protein
MTNKYGLKVFIAQAQEPFKKLFTTVNTTTISSCVIVTIIHFNHGACTIKHYGFVICGKWSDFVVS